MVNNADRVIRTMQHAGVRRLFGSGGAAGELFAAAERAGLAFARAHSPAAAAFMACGHAERTGCPGACALPAGTGLSTLAPAWEYARADGVPLLTVSEEEEDAGIAYCAGRSFRLDAGCECEELQRLLSALRAGPAGPLHLSAASGLLETAVSPAWSPQAGQSTAEPPSLLPESMRALLRGSSRPVLLLGSGTRTADAARAARNLAAEVGIPVLATPKAKGVVPDRHPWFAGVWTPNGRENPLLKRADLFLLAGFESGAAPLGSQPYRQPSVTLPPGAAWSLEAAAGDLPQRSGWTTVELHAIARDQQASLSLETAVEGAYYGSALELASVEWKRAIAVVDAGPHRSAAIRYWPVQEPNELLTPTESAPASYGLPAAIGAALADPSRPVAVFLGQEGLLAAAPELETAARYKLRLRVLAFVEPGTSIDWGGLGSSLGVPSSAPQDERTLRTALRQATAFAGPALVVKGDFR